MTTSPRSPSAAPPGLQELISTWLTTDPYQGAVGGKLVIFFRNMFQQTGFLPDGGLQAAAADQRRLRLRRQHAQRRRRRVPAPGENLQDSFAMTAWQLVKEGRPFTETLTTRRFVMTTALKSLYVQVEMTPDNGRTTTAGPAWTIDYSGGADPDRDRADQHDVQRRGPCDHGADRDLHRVPRWRRRSRPAPSRARRGCSSACSASRRSSRSPEPRCAPSTRRSRTSRPKTSLTGRG